MVRARVGMLTPETKILCYPCRGIDPLGLEHDLHVANDLTTCDNCSNIVQVDERLAKKNSLKRAIRYNGIHAYLLSKGGVRVDLAEGGSIVINYNGEEYTLAYYIEDTLTFKITTYSFYEALKNVLYTN